LAIATATTQALAGLFTNDPPASQPSSEPPRRPWGGPRGDGGGRGFHGPPREPSQPADPSRQDPADGGLLVYTKLRTYRWRVTFTFNSPPDGIHDVVGFFAVPVEWPEQSAKFVEEVKPAKLRTRPRDVPGVGLLEIASASVIGGGRSVGVERYYELTRYAVRFLPKGDTDGLRIPTELPEAVKPHLGVAPGIETTLPKILALGKSLRDSEGRPWVTAKNCFDWVRKNVRYDAGNYRGAKFAMEKGLGDCEDLTALFIALCRGQGIPARSVWVEGHVYPEFYLEDPKASAACWIPCQLVGPPWFGRMPDTRVILQKGDRVEDPLRGGTIRYLPHSAKAIGGQVTIDCRHEELDASGKPIPARQNLK
jgi:transglutaminase-like putative cysteine protease